ncbi:hypothetical protein OPQ81_000748 [Rhizoctonia solani]|nr:hypothetical protein OPQ81_000748 [Rhizoctonia solani]
MSRNMDSLFVRARRPLRIHFDDTRITAVAIRQLSWRVEQGGGTIVEHPSGADILVVDPAAPWVFHDFLRTKLPELRPSVVLAFWIPLCLATRSLIWINHPYWQQVVVPSERLSHSEIPQGVTAYSSFLAGITYSKIYPFFSTKAMPHSSNALKRDSSVISNFDNSDLEVSQSVEPGASSEDEPPEIASKPKQPVSRGILPRSDPPSTTALSQRPTEVQKDEVPVSKILPAKASLPLDDIDMLPPSPLPEPVHRPRKEATIKNVGPPGDSAPAGLAEKLPLTRPDPSGTHSHSSSRHSSPRVEREITLSRAGSSPASVAVGVLHSGSPKFDSIQPAIETGLPTVLQYVVAEPRSPIASERPTAPKETYAPPTLDSVPSPASEEQNSTPLESSPQVPNVSTNKLSIGTNEALDTPEAPSSVSTVPSMARSEPATVPEPPGALDEPQGRQDEASIETNVSTKLAEYIGSPITLADTSSPTEPIKPQASTSSAPPNTLTSIPKTSAPFEKSSVSTPSIGIKYVPDPSTTTQSPKPSLSNTSKVSVQPKMRPPPQTDENDSIASSSSPRTSLSHPKSKLNIQSGLNGTSMKPRPSVASTAESTPPIKPGQGSTSITAAPVDGPASTISSSVTNTTGSLPTSANVAPATVVVVDTPNPAPGFSLSRPKKLVIRSPTIPTTALDPPSTSVSPTQTRHSVTTPTSQLRSPPPEVVSLFAPPPTPPTPTPEQLTALAAKRSAWTKEEDQYIIDYMNWVFAQDPLASTSEIMREIAANCPYRSVGNWQNRFRSKEDSIYMNEVPVLFERLTNKTSGRSNGRNNIKTLEILSGTRTRNRGAVDYVDSSEDENEDSNNDESGPPRKRTRRSQASGRRRSSRLG